MTNTVTGPPFTIERYESLGECIVAERDSLRAALLDLYNGTAEYVYLNNLGDPHNTTPMRRAAEVLGVRYPRSMRDASDEPNSPLPICDCSTSWKGCEAQAGRTCAVSHYHREYTPAEKSNQDGQQTPVPSGHAGLGAAGQGPSSDQPSLKSNPARCPDCGVGAEFDGVWHKPGCPQLKSTL